MVEAILTDADGREWRLNEKATYFREHADLVDPTLPMDISADCTVVGGDGDRIRVRLADWFYDERVFEIARSALVEG
jgi:hypothetical protein